MPLVSGSNKVAGGYQGYVREGGNGPTVWRGPVRKLRREAAADAEREWRKRGGR